jgi:hypothetical protein
MRDRHDTLLALLPVREVAGDDVIFVTEGALQQADQVIKSGDIGFALFKRQWEEYKNEELTPAELRAFETFVQKNLVEVAFAYISRALALVAAEALDGKYTQANCKLREPCRNSEKDGGRVLRVELRLPETRREQVLVQDVDNAGDLAPRS